MGDVDVGGKYIFHALNSGANISSIVDPIVDASVGGDVSSSVASMVNFCLFVAGAAVDVEPSAFTPDADITAVLEEIVARVGESDCISILWAKDSKTKRLRKDFCSFFQSVVLASGSQNATELVSTLISWLVHMNESKVRSFRHVALVAAAGIVDGLNELLRVHSTKQGTSRGGNASSRALFQEQISSVLQHTLHNRIKDVSPEIRLVALQCLRRWIIAFPERYCTNSYLIYLRFALYDKRPEMRLEALESIGAILCEVPSGFSKSAALLSKCIERLVEMCKDVDTRCAHSAIKLCTVLVRSDFSFEHSLLDEIFEGLLDDRSIIRSAVGVFLKHFMAVTTKSTGASPFAFIVALLQTLKYQCPSLVEEYLVDALWSDEDPPFLNEISGFSKMIDGSVDEDVLKALRCIASLLKRAGGGEASLGPAPKDDLYAVARGKKKGDLRSKLLSEYSKFVCASIPTILSRFGTASDFLAAVAAVLTHLHFDACDPNSLKSAFGAFRTSCMLCSFDLATVPIIAEAWRALAFGQHLESGLGEFELKELSREVVGAVGPAYTGGSVMDWSRMILLTTISRIDTDSWDGILSRLLASVSSKDSQRVGSVGMVCFNMVMWSLASDSRDGGAVTSSTQISASTLSQIFIEYVSGLQMAGVEPIVVNLLVCVCDLLAIPTVSVSDSLNSELIVAISRCIDTLSCSSRAQMTIVKDLSRQLAAGEKWDQYVPARADHAVTEGRCTRVVASAVRLFLIKKLDAQLSFELFGIWPLVSKSASDILKQLFHALRERSGGDGFSFEKSILSASIAQCAATSATPNHGTGAVGMLGSKIASIHFAPADRFYGCCVKMVTHALDECVHEPLWLHATVMYCSKLRQEDALAMFRHAQRLQSSVGDNPYFGTYLYAIARAAKVADVKLPKNAKRGRDTECEGVSVDPDLSDALGAAESPSDAQTSDSGWRNAKSGVSERTLVATQEWE